MRAAVGPHPAPVQRHLVEPNQPHPHRQTANLAEQIFQLTVETGAEIAERRVVNRPSLHQPHEVHGVAAGPLQTPAGTDAVTHPVENGPGHDHRWNGRLTGHPAVVTLPRRPVHTGQDLLEQPNRMIIGNAITQGGRDQNDLIPRKRRFIPVAHRVILLATDSIKLLRIIPNLSSDISKNHAN